LEDSLFIYRVNSAKIDFPYAGLSNFDDKERHVVLVGAATLCSTKYSSFMQAIFRVIYWLRLWAQLQHKDTTKVLFQRMSLALEAVALELTNHGCKHNLRIGLDHFSFVHSPD